VIRLLLLPLALAMAIAGVAIAVAECVERRHRAARDRWLEQRRRRGAILSTPQERTAGNATSGATAGGNGDSAGAPIPAAARRFDRPESW
jgi:hypothetical protein